MIGWSYTDAVLIIVLTFFVGYAVGRLRSLVAASRR